MSEADYQNRMVEWECNHAIRCARLGYLFANGLLTAEEASEVIYECQPIAGWYPLETFSVEGVLDAAENYWTDSREALRPVAREAADYVWQKWSSTGDPAGAAEDWAIDVIGERAGEYGIQLHWVEQEEATA